MAGPHISLITPVYNTLEYLSACVDCPKRNWHQHLDSLCNMCRRANI